jgi:hypothetical protein
VLQRVRKGAPVKEEDDMGDKSPKAIKKDKSQKDAAKKQSKHDQNKRQASFAASSANKAQKK